MTNQQKIDLGREIIQKLKFDVTRLNPGKYEDLCFETGDFALNKISEIHKKDAAIWLEEIANSGHHSEAFNNLPDPLDGKILCTCHNLFGPNTDDNGYICGVCYSLKCNECIDNDFERCPICEHAGKEKIVLKDKNGAIFQSGDTLRNDLNLTTEIKILQINETHVVMNNGGIIKKQDWVDTCWIVHEGTPPLKDVFKNLYPNDKPQKNQLINQDDK